MIQIKKESLKGITKKILIFFKTVLRKVNVCHQRSFIQYEDIKIVDK